MQFIQYPKCSTCKRAKKWLDDHDIEYTSRHIVEDTPTAEELKTWYEANDYPLKGFFNTSGQVYRRLNLKDKLKNLSEEEQFELLSSDGMLIKRPLLVKGDKIIIGFKEGEWEQKLVN